MLILGIETSCDETAASVIDKDLSIISNVIFSQQKKHSSFFGVVPELASRYHFEKIHFVIKKALSKINIRKINLISFTKEPGLKGSLLIGRIVAETLGYIHSIPTIGVDHLMGHISSLFLTYKKEIIFPFISLIISGGHTELSLVHSPTKRDILGSTRDDAVGESFDKVAKMLKLSYPGGPIIEKMAQKGDKNSILLRRPLMSNSWDFSFSGIKTAVLYYINSKKKQIKFKEKCDICASFQEAIKDTLIFKSFAAAKKFNIPRIGISGGVSANNYIRKKFLEEAFKSNIKIYLPQKELTTDNASMIACAGLYNFNQ